MENKIVLFSVLAVLALFALPSVSATYPASTVYFEPEDSIGKFGEDTHVKVMINASVSTLSTAMDIFFNPSCVNITDVNFTGNAYFQQKNWAHWGHYVRVGAMNFQPGAVYPGVNLVSTLTLQCVNESNCTSDLGFGGTLEIGNYPDNDPVYTEWHNGTFTCSKIEKPDLVISEKYETQEDGYFTVTYTVANVGAGDADARNTSISVDGTVLKDPVPALGAGESYNNTVGKFECPCGMNVTVLVCADCEGVVDEEDEENNCLKNVFECPPCPQNCV